MRSGFLERLARAPLVRAATVAFSLAAAAPPPSAAAENHPDTVSVLDTTTRLREAELARLGRRRRAVVRPMPCEPQYIIVHTSEGWDSRSYIHRNGLAHVVVDSAGRATQHVPFDYVADHAGVSWWGDERVRHCSIGIEMLGFSNPFKRRGEPVVFPRPLPERELDTTRQLIEQLRRQFNIPHYRVLPHALIAASYTADGIVLGRRRSDGIEAMHQLGYPLACVPVGSEVPARLDAQTMRRIDWNRWHPGDGAGYMAAVGASSSNPGAWFEYFIEQPVPAEQARLYESLSLPCEAPPAERAALRLPPIRVAEVLPTPKDVPAPIPEVPQPVYAIVPQRDVRVTRSARSLA